MERELVQVACKESSVYSRCLLSMITMIIDKSTHATAYKGTLKDGNQVDVKRLREKIAKRLEEFEAKVVKLEKIRHQNRLAFRAYYMRPKGDKLLVFD